MARTQLERRAETEGRFLAAAAAIIAEHGIEGASVDAIAQAAGRTSGALYGRFGSKDGLLFELLDSWKNEVAARTTNDLLDADTLDEQLRALWRNFAEADATTGRWVQLEHELWRWAIREGNDTARERLGHRYRDAWRSVADMLEAWVGAGLIDPPMEVERLAPSLVAALIGFEMEHRVDPGIVDEETVVAALRALVGARAEPRTRRRRPR
jgi:AcrR family transcriptional regulator